MPRIRKKTSKRGTTNQREKIKHKATESRKKKKKEVKKNTQWKSKQKKDLGIPNNFPYKDQILAEVAEQRRQAEEAKQRRKEEKKAAKAGGDVSEEDVALVGVTSLDKPAGSTSSKARVEKAAEHEDVPILMNAEFPNLKAVLDLADVVFEVLDARDPLTYRSSHLEEYVRSRSNTKLALVLNKIDTSPKEAVQSWATTLRKDHPTFLFRSSSSSLPSSDGGKGKAKANDALGLDPVLEYLTKCSEDHGKEEPLVIAVVGLTNVGKSSFVNSLIQQNLLPIYTLTTTTKDGPTTTPYAQELPLDISSKKFRIIDTPGVGWVFNDEGQIEEIEKDRTRDILARNRGRVDRLKDPLPVVRSIVSRANKEDLMLFYNIPAFSEGDVDGFLAAVARSNSLLKKGGEPDSTNASRIVLRDWSTGKLPRYTVPPPPPNAGALEDSDATIIATLASRKELRRTSGLVKLKSGEIDSRRVALEVLWVVQKGSESSEEESDDDDDDAMEEGKAGDDSDENESESEDDGDEDEDEGDHGSDEEEDEVELPPPGKRKRGPTQPPRKSVKKVAFAVEPTKQKRGRKISQTAPKPTIQKRLAKPPTAPKKRPAGAAPVTKLLKVANSSSPKGTAPKSTGSEEAYDFKKFF